MEVRRDFSITQILMMVEMLSIRNKPGLNIAALARQLHVSPSSKGFRDLLTYLKEWGIIACRDTAGTSQLITIDHDRLSDEILDEQDLINLLVDRYLAVHHTFVW